MTRTIFPSEYRAAHQAQAAALKSEAAEYGLRFPGYFVPSVAEWVLSEVESGRFLGPSEAVFVAMQVFMELDAYPDLRQELFKREMDKRLADKSPGIPADEVFAGFEEKMATGPNSGSTCVGEKAEHTSRTTVNKLPKRT